MLSSTRPRRDGFTDGPVPWTQHELVFLSHFRTWSSLLPRCMLQPPAPAEPPLRGGKPRELRPAQAGIIPWLWTLRSVNSADQVHIALNGIPEKRLLAGNLQTHF